MSYEDQTCIFCESEDIFKVPHAMLTLDASKVATKGRTGQVVDNYIKETKEIIKKEKTDLKRREL